MNKFCPNCGAEVPSGGDICLKCGHMINKNQNNNNKSNTNIFGIVAFVLSIIAFLTSFIIIGVFLGIISFILSIVGLVSSKKLNNGKGLSIAALIISIITILIGIVYTIIIGFFIVDNGSAIKEEIQRQTCKTYGSEYSLTNGSDVSGSNDYDDWYCCPNNKTKSIRNCIEID